MKIRSRSKERFKLPAAARFKGEQRLLKIRAGTIAKFNERVGFGYTTRKKPSNGSNEKIWKGNKGSASRKNGVNSALLFESEDGTSLNETTVRGNDRFSTDPSSQAKPMDIENAHWQSSSKKQTSSRSAEENRLRESFKRKKKQREGTAKSGAFSSNSVISSALKAAGTKQLFEQSFNVLDQEEDAEGVQHFKENVSHSKQVFKGTKKATGFVTKNQKFSESVTVGKLESLRFGGDKQAGKAAAAAVRNTRRTANQQASASVGVKIHQAITQATSKVVASFTASNPIGWIIAGGALVLLVFFGLLFFFNSQSSASTNDGVFYVKHWDGNDAYHSSLLAQRYGITAEQIDGFIANEGYSVDSRATGEEFLRLQALSGIDVRMLVAFAQWESSYGTAGVALQFPKANIFGYGAFDNDPNQGASWDNSRAVTDFRSTQIDSYNNRTLAIMDARASAFHNNTLKPGEFVYWTALDAGKPRAETAEKLDKWIDDHGGTPEPPGGYGPVNGGGGGGAGLAVLDQKIGTVISGDYGGLTGECYAVSAYYAHSINPSIILRGGVKASDIGIDYPWTSWGWTVIKNPGYQQIRAGDIINYQTGGNLGPWSASSLYGHTGVVGKVLGNNQYLLYDQNPGPLKTWTVTFYPGSVASVVRPPTK